MYGAELIFEENYLGGAGRDGHTARGHPSVRPRIAWSFVVAARSSYEVRSFKRLRACDELRRRGPRWKVQAYKHHVAEARNADRLGSDSRPGAGRKPATRPARPGDGVCASKNDTGQAGCPAPGGGAGGHRDLRGKSPDFKFTNYNPPTPSALQFRDLCGKSPDFMQISTLQSQSRIGPQGQHA